MRLAEKWQRCWRRYFSGVFSWINHSWSLAGHRDSVHWTTAAHRQRIVIRNPAGLNRFIDVWHKRRERQSLVLRFPSIHHEGRPGVLLFGGAENAEVENAGVENAGATKSEKILSSTRRNMTVVAFMPTCCQTQLISELFAFLGHLQHITIDSVSC